MHLNELNIYRIAVKLRNEIHQKMNLISNYQHIDDIRQIRRSSASVPANIAEGFGRRFYPKDFGRFLVIALGSNEEGKSHIGSLQNNGQISKEEAVYFSKNIRDLSVRISNLIKTNKEKYK